MDTLHGMAMSCEASDRILNFCVLIRRNACNGKNAGFRCVSMAQS